MEKRLTRRDLLRTFGVGIAATALAACAPKIVEVTKIVEKEKIVQQTVVVEKEVVKEAPKPKGEVTFWGHDQHPMDLAAEGFVRKYPDIKWQAPHPADRGEKIRATMAAGSGCPDLYWAEATEAQEWGCNGLTTDLTDLITPIKDDFHPAKLNECFIAKTGKYHGWPGDISVSGYYYRWDQMEKLGYKDVNFDTWTYDDFITMSSEIAKKGKFTFCFPAGGWSALFQFTIHQLGGSCVSKDGQTITAGDDKGIAAMEIVKKLWDCKGGMDIGWWSPEYWVAIQEGTLIGDFEAAWSKGFWEAQIKTPDKGLGYWKIAKFPGGGGIKNRTGIWGGAQLVNPKCSKNRDNAILYMQYALGSLEGCALTGGWGIIPSYRPYLTSSLFLKGRSSIFGDWPFNEFWAGQEKELSPDFYRPAGWGAVDAIIGKEMPAILKGEISVKDGMAKIVQFSTQDFERSKCK